MWFIWPGGVFTKTEMSEVLTEVVKMDPTFTQERFIQDCRTVYIPNILEVIVLRFSPVKSKQKTRAVKDLEYKITKVHFSLLILTI